MKGPCTSVRCSRLSPSLDAAGRARSLTPDEIAAKGGVGPSSCKQPSGASRWSRSPKRLLIGLALAIGSAGCSLRAPTQVTCPQATYPPDQIGRASITQGVAGNVWEWKGPFPQCGSVKAVVRTVLVYPLTPAAAFPGLAGSAVFVDSFPVAPVDSTRSDSAGFFEVALPVGSYSLILREAGRLYVRTQTSNYANLGQADVVAGAVTARGLWLTYMASF